MSPMMLPFTPRFIALTLATLATVGFGIAWAADPRLSLLGICFGIATVLTAIGLHDLFQKSVVKIKIVNVKMLGLRLGKRLQLWHQ